MTALAAITELRALIEKEADSSESDGTLSQAVVDAFTDASLFQLMVPAELGGLDADTDTVIDVLSAASYADGATGWSLMANVNSTAYLAYIAPEAAKKILQTGTGCAAGMFSPVGGVAHKNDDGYQVSGAYQFGSGSNHASYIGCGSIVMENGEMPAPHPSGMPISRCCFIPKENAVMQGNWDVIGLCATGSYDYAVPEQLVAADFSFDLFDAPAQSGGAVFDMGPVPLAAICHTGWCLGVARRALDEIRDIANAGRARMGAPPMKEQGVFQRPFAKHSMALAAAEAYNRTMYRDIVKTLEDGQPMSNAMFEETRSAATFITQVAEEAVTFAYQQAGSKGMRNPSVLQRCMRDIMVGGRHMFVDDKNYESWATVLLAQ